MIKILSFYHTFFLVFLIHTWALLSCYTSYRIVCLTHLFICSHHISTIFQQHRLIQFFCYLYIFFFCISFLQKQTFPRSPLCSNKESNKKIYVCLFCFFLFLLRTHLLLLPVNMFDRSHYPYFVVFWRRFVQKLTILTR